MRDHFEGYNPKSDERRGEDERCAAFFQHRHGFYLAGNFGVQPQLASIPQGIEIGAGGTRSSALWSTKRSNGRSPNSPPAPTATANGPIKVNTAQWAPRMPKMIAPTLVVCCAAESGGSLTS